MAQRRPTLQQMDELLARYEAVREEDPLERVRAHCHAYIDLARTEPELFRVMFLFPPDLGPDAGAGLPDDIEERLDRIAADISAAERRAMVAERETVDRLIAGWLADQVGAIVKIRSYAPGTTITVTVDLPTGGSKSFKVTLGTAPSN